MTEEEIAELQSFLSKSFTDCNIAMGYEDKVFSNGTQTEITIKLFRYNKQGSDNCQIEELNA